MKINLVLLALVAIQLTSCNKNENNEIEQNINIEIDSTVKSEADTVVVEETNLTETLAIKNEDFKNYVNSLNTIPFPIQYKDDVENKFPEYSKDFDKKLFKKFKANNTEYPVGIYKITKNYIAILEIDNTMLTIPVLNTYDENGKKISSKLIYEFNEPEPGFSAENNLKFEEDKITNTQTFTTSDFDEDLFEPINGTEKKSINKYTISINENGKIKLN